ncbi:phenylacetate-coenzyme A ligase [Clostridium homopropionicum DSM 5847]|uniref:Phenylacetate-coenzyme A ligase n=1 Tax=Clostridium homopropionicum DSM 5847 TaxID=1121318 RepID=A0A0L6Z632_9CLOT|nr:phenylacetate--CoA ligase [Clostridium homopropionicum]KOA18427.1 phenylacetate-coenzyme A ligase [Clostridium homopropionicum DSM 5847]SFF67035.1 phenylacetate-CoA ligase [Clostridium homopropionicum]
MIWDERSECMSRDEMRELQGRRLRHTVERVYHNVPFYRKKMHELGLEPGDIQGIEDLSKLPFTTKQDLRENYPFGLAAIPMSQIVRLHASSGTTGKPVVVGYSRKDLRTWSEVVARALYSYGVDNHDFIQVAYGYGLFTGGMGLHYGAEKVGAAVIPISGGNTKKQIQIMKDFGSTALACTPSYALYIAESMQEMGIKREDLKLRVGIFGAEPWTENMRKEIEESLNIKAMDIYGLSEIIGPGVAYDCEMKNGLHINEDHFVPEIINPETCEVLPYGSKGELVFTTITKEGMPLLRYRTRDLTVLKDGECECGRTLVRMEKILGRSDDMIIIRGVNVFPSQVESVLLEMGETKPHYMLFVDRVNNLDILEVWVEVDEVFFSDQIRKLESLTKKIKHNIESTLGIGIKLKLVEPKTIERSEGKAKRLIDRRVL